MNRIWPAVLFGCICALIAALLVGGGASEAGAPARAPASVVQNTTICEQAYTGTMRSVYRICSTNSSISISGQSGIHLANYDLWVHTPQPRPCITITIASRLAVTSSSVLPLNIGSLPGDVQYHLQPEPHFIQSDDPAIIGLAQELTTGVTQQDRAVARVMSWVGSHISYTNSVVSNDALSVLNSRTGSRQGFAALAAALLRASGVPTQYVTGGVVNFSVLNWAWPVPDQGDYHWWVLVYYPDIGWVPSDPQHTINWIDTSHIAAPFNQLGMELVEITRLSHSESITLTEQYGQPFTDTLVRDEPLYSAVNTAGHLLEFSPLGFYLLLPKSEPQHTVTLTVASLRCDGLWTLSSNRTWITPDVTAGSVGTAVRLDIDTNGLAPGVYTARLTLSTDSSSDYTPLSRALPVTLVLAEQIHTINLPAVTRP